MAQEQQPSSKKEKQFQPLVCGLTKQKPQCPVIFADGFIYDKKALQTWLKLNPQSNKGPSGESVIAADRYVEYDPTEPCPVTKENVDDLKQPVLLWSRKESTSADSSSIYEASALIEYIQKTWCEYLPFSLEILPKEAQDQDLRELKDICFMVPLRAFKANFPVPELPCRKTPTPFSDRVTWRKRLAYKSIYNSDCGANSHDHSEKIEDLCGVEPDKTKVIQNVRFYYCTLGYHDKHFTYCNCWFDHCIFDTMCMCGMRFRSCRFSSCTFIDLQRGNNPDLFIGCEIQGPSIAVKCDEACFRSIAHSYNIVTYKKKNW